MRIFMAVITKKRGCFFVQKQPRVIKKLKKFFPMVQGTNFPPFRKRNRGKKNVTQEFIAILTFLNN